jgi:hypothetical protein
VTAVVPHPFVGRISTAWRNSMMSDRRTICTIAGLPFEAASREWWQLSVLERELIVQAMPHLRALATDFAGA